jgi:hypothetical protein
MANRIGEHMEEHGIKFIKQFVPIKVSRTICKFVDSILVIKTREGW